MEPNFNYPFSKKIIAYNVNPSIIQLYWKCPWSTNINNGQHNPINYYFDYYLSIKYIKGGYRKINSDINTLNLIKSFVLNDSIPLEV